MHESSQKKKKKRHGSQNWVKTLGCNKENGNSMEDKSQQSSENKFLSSHTRKHACSPVLKGRL